MPVTKCGNGKYRIGSGPCVFTSQAAANRAQAAFHAKNPSKKDISPFKMVLLSRIFNDESQSLEEINKVWELINKI